MVRSTLIEHRHERNKQTNKAFHRTKRHVETIEEIRHKLQGAKRFSDMDMGNGYHQIGLVEDSRCIGIFQTYEGLHRFKVLFFGVSSATELTDLPGYTSIHDNILVWRRIPGEHEANLDACLFDEKNGPLDDLSVLHIGRPKKDPNY